MEKKKIKTLYKSGYKRIKSKNHKLYKKFFFFWKYNAELTLSQKKLIEKYIKNKNSDLIQDIDDNNFFKGYINSKKIISGERIRYLPNGKKLARAGFSLFAKNLKLNDLSNEINKDFDNKKKDKTHSVLEDYHWDISYENTSGLKTYLYTVDKLHLEQKKKKNIVNKFEKKYIDIIEKLEKELMNDPNIESLTLYTLLKTMIRVGNLDYYNRNHHKGLTTLQKKDIFVDKGNNSVRFIFIGKDGVPQNIVKKFPYFYISILENHLNAIDNLDEFVFAKNDFPIHSSEISKLLFEYTGEHFYPHIIRSHYADKVCERFLENHDKENTSKDDVDNVFNMIAENLGHKKYNSKLNIWEINSKITIESYIYPELTKKIKKLYY